MSHPYFPEDVVLPNFGTPVYTFDQILVYFGTAATVAFVSMWFLSGKYKYLSFVERLWCCWFLVSGFIHLIVEGTVVVNSKFYQDQSGNFLNEIWKEYAKADSRYATRDAFVVQMEGITAFVEGPACFLAVYSLLYRKSYRFTAMILVSLGQLYGDVLYFLTCFHEDLRHSRPEPLYFWGYFVGANAIWIVLPTLCIIYCAHYINRAIAASPSSGPASKRKDN